MTTERSGMSLETAIATMAAMAYAKDAEGIVDAWEVIKSNLSRDAVVSADGWNCIRCGAFTDVCPKCADEMSFYARHAAVPDGWRDVVSKVLTALDKATGDTDPNIDPDMTDDEVRDEYPEIWAMQKLSALLDATNLKEYERKGWVFVPVDPTDEMLHASAIEWTRLCNGYPPQGSHYEFMRGLWKAMLAQRDGGATDGHL